MSRFPLDLRFGGLVITTDAVAGTYLVSTVIAAPGAGNRLRIWQVGISPYDIYNVIPQKLYANWQSGGINLWGQSIIGSVLVPMVNNIPGGFHLTTNSALALFHGDNVASQKYYAWAHYTTEPV